MKTLGGIFERNEVEIKLKEIEVILQKENFWKDKDLVKKTLKQKKIFEGILSSYKESLKEIHNLKDLFNLASQESDEEIIEDCILKVEKVYKTEKGIVQVNSGAISDFIVLQFPILI